MNGAPTRNEMAEQIFAIGYEENIRKSTSKRGRLHKVEVTCPDGSTVNIPASGLNIYDLTGGPSTHPVVTRKGKTSGLIMGTEPMIAAHQARFEENVLVAILNRIDRESGPVKVIRAEEKPEPTLKEAAKPKLPIPDSIIAGIQTALQGILADPELLHAIQRRHMTWPFKI